MSLRWVLPIFDLWLKRQPRSYVLLRLAAEIQARSDPQEKFSQLSSLAKDLGIPSRTANGELGLFEGSVEDQAAWGAYLRDKTYNAGYQALVIEQIFKSGSGHI